jgi:hypothetical protein
MLAVVSNIVVAVSALFVAVVAIRGINTWRKQLVGKAIFQAAKKLMEAAYRVIDGYQTATSLVTYPGESIDRTRQLGESQELKLVLDEGFARSKRLQTIVNDLNGLAEANLETRTILGLEASKGIQASILAIRMEIWDLSSAIQMYFYFIRKNEVDSGSTFGDATFKDKMFKTVYQSPDSEHVKRLNTIVASLDEELRPYLGSGKKNIKTTTSVLDDIEQKPNEVETSLKNLNETRQKDKMQNAWLAVAIMCWTAMVTAFVAMPKSIASIGLKWVIFGVGLLGVIGAYYKIQRLIKKKSKLKQGDELMAKKETKEPTNQDILNKINNLRRDTLVTLGASVIIAGLILAVSASTLKSYVYGGCLCVLGAAFVIYVFISNHCRMNK